jgi:hypothetical protein
MRVDRKRAVSLAVLLVSYSATIAGLVSLAILPLVGVLVTLGGSALAICSAAELIQQASAPDSSASIRGE